MSPKMSSKKSSTSKKFVIKEKGKNIELVIQLLTGNSDTWFRQNNHP